MTITTASADLARTPAQQSLPQRPSYLRVVEQIDKWANSPGLQKPTRGPRRDADGSKLRADGPLIRLR